MQTVTLSDANYREPQSIEEYLVGAMEHSSHCVEGDALIPPPSNCPSSVQTMYHASQSHILTYIVVLIFAVILFQLIMMAINPLGGEH